ncbi:hypothetical protein [Methylocystis sp. B8]|uniref:hypothetical protein n=1 Tax=Methylocystis sp. B8 TaxID=544938 RepID=UPI0010FD4C68|nr:hypothetical protein [Methylocystis sp. B8]TLG77800.1 hypothetical protein FEV16_08235 [Methylocystis sp. B8]
MNKATLSVVALATVSLTATASSALAASQMHDLQTIWNQKASHGVEQARIVFPGIIKHCPPGYHGRPPYCCRRILGIVRHP